MSKLTSIFVLIFRWLLLGCYCTVDVINHPLPHNAPRLGALRSALTLATIRLGCVWYRHTYVYIYSIVLGNVHEKVHGNEHERAWYIEQVGVHCSVYENHSMVSIETSIMLRMETYIELGTYMSICIEWCMKTCMETCMYTCIWQ